MALERNPLDCYSLTQEDNTLNQRYFLAIKANNGCRYVVLYLLININ